MSNVFGPKKPLFGPYTYRAKQNSNGDTLIAVYHGAKRIAHMDAYWAYSMRSIEEHEAEETQRAAGGRRRRLVCASDLRALGAGGKYPNVLTVGHAYIDDDAYKGKGIGRAMYEAMMVEGYAVRETRVGGSPGPMFFIPDECKGAGNTSAEAQRVWASLVRDYPSRGTSIRVDAPPIIGSRAKPNPRRQRRNSSSALRAFREALAATSVRSNPAARKRAAESPAALGALSSALREMARRFLLVDPKDVPDADLVAVLLAGAVEGDPSDAATGLLSDVQGNLARVARAEGFARRAGFTTLAQARMTAAAELVKRAERRASVEGLGGTVTGPAEAERIARAYIGGPREQMGALFFDSQLRLLGFRILSMGGQTMTVADPREVVIAALEMRAKVVILVHNHPSGVPSPSSEDDTTTARLKEILRLLNMQLADHLILGKDYDIYSYAMNMRLNPRRANPRANPAASDTTGRTPPKNLRIEFYDEDGDNDPRVERMAEAAWKIALASPIRILSNKRLSAIAVLGRKVVGAAWYSVDFSWSDDEPSQFSFDIVVAPEAQGKGIGDALVGEMLDQFRHARGGQEELVLNVEVVNPAMERILARRGFRLRDEEDPLAVRGVTMMTRPNRRR